MPKYKYGVPNAETDLDEFRKALDSCFMETIYKAYLVILYWLGCRRSEPLFIKKEDIEETEGSLFITITVNPTIPYSRCKLGRAGGPTELPLFLYGVDLIKEAWQQTKSLGPLFPFSDKTGYRKVKELFPKKSPHWLRHNRLTKLRKLRDQGKITTDHIKSYTGIRRDSTIEHYGMKTKSGIHKIATVLE